MQHPNLSFRYATQKRVETSPGGFSGVPGKKKVRRRQYRKAPSSEVSSSPFRFIAFLTCDAYENVVEGCTASSWSPTPSNAFLQLQLVFVPRSSFLEHLSSILNSCRIQSGFDNDSLETRKHRKGRRNVFFSFPSPRIKSPFGEKEQDFSLLLWV